jgi:hypothetical protein
MMDKFPRPAVAVVGRNDRNDLTRRAQHAVPLRWSGRVVVCPVGPAAGGGGASPTATGGLVCPRAGTRFATHLQIIDYVRFISMNRKHPLAHPMLVDVDLKEGYPDGRA